MGQYYMPIVQATKITKKRKVVKKMFAFNIADLNESKKIAHHCEFESLISKIVSNFMVQLNKDGFDTQLVWLGDYAQHSFTPGKDLYDKMKYKTVKLHFDIGLDKMVIDGVTPFKINTRHYFLINKEKNEYVSLESYAGSCCPLILLTADGNGKGGGDYFGNDFEYVGRWKYDTIVITDTLTRESNLCSEIPMREIKPKFSFD